MNFQEICHHLEENACVIDHYEDDIYYASNLLNNQMCQISVENKFEDLMVVHICYELGVPATPELTNELDNYREFRDKQLSPN